MLALRQPSGSLGAAADAAPPPGPTEAVTRPPPGLARGHWEAPAWAFWVALAVVLAGVAAYVAWRAGLLRVKKTTPPGSTTTPPKRGDRP